LNRSPKDTYYKTGLTNLNITEGVRTYFVRTPFHTFSIRGIVCYTISVFVRICEVLTNVKVKLSLLYRRYSNGGFFVFLGVMPEANPESFSIPLKFRPHDTKLPVSAPVPKWSGLPSPTKRRQAVCLPPFIKSSLLFYFEHNVVHLLDNTPTGNHAAQRSQRINRRALAHYRAGIQHAPAANIGTVT